MCNAQVHTKQENVYPRPVGLVGGLGGGTEPLPPEFDPNPFPRLLEAQLLWRVTGNTKYNVPSFLPQTDEDEDLMPCRA